MSIQQPEQLPRGSSPLGLPAAARLHVWQIQAVRDVLLILALIGLVWLGYAMRAVTVPLLIALTLAYLFEPLVLRLTSKNGISRPIVVGGLLLTVGIGFVVLLAILVPLVIGQTLRFAEDVRAGRFEDKLLRLKEMIPAEYQPEFDQVTSWMISREASAFNGADSRSDSIEPGAAEPFARPAAPMLVDEHRVRQLIREEMAQSPVVVSQSGSPLWQYARRGGETVANLLGAVIALGLLAFLIPFYFYFFSVSFPAVTAFGRDLIPESSRPRALELLGKMDRAIAGFVRGRIVICLMMGVMLAFGWWLCGVPYAIVLGLLIGAFSIVPYLGGIGIPLAIGLLAIEQLGLPPEARMAWWKIILWPTVVFAIVQVIETYILTPTIAGRATNLDPVTILVAVLAGGSVGGVYGMILAIPVAACLKIIVTDVLLPRIRAWARGESRDPLPISRQ